MRRLIALVVVFTGLCWPVGVASFTAADRQAGGGIDIMIVNDADEPVFFFVCGKYGATPRIDLPNNGDYAVIHFQDKVNERALVSFDGDGKKIIQCMKFVPGPFW
jgi:hypothetical protein